MFRQIGPGEIILILAVVVLLFGAKRLPELARGSGRALRIFKTEVKGLHDDDAAEDSTTAPGASDTSARREVGPAEPTVAPVTDPTRSDTPRDRG